MTRVYYSEINSMRAYLENAKASDCVCEAEQKWTEVPKHALTQAIPFF